MISVSDILKLLEKAPIWKTLKDMPGRIDALEKRVAELEAAPKQPGHLHTCEQCGAPAKITKVKEHPTFGFAGRKVRVITCDNGHSLEYDWTPGEN